MYMSVEYKNFAGCLKELGDAGQNLLNGITSSSLSQINQAVGEFKDAIQGAIDDGKQSRLSQFDQSSSPDDANRSDAQAENFSPGGAEKGSPSTEQQSEGHSAGTLSPQQSELKSPERDVPATQEAVPQPQASPPQQQQQQQQGLSM
jgi:hypothetical protein